MKKELDEKLCKDFPNLYTDRRNDMMATCMCWGFECGDGWFELIYDLSSKLEPLITNIIKKDRKWYRRLYRYISKRLYWLKNHKLFPGEIVRKMGSMSWKDYNKISQRYYPRASQVKEKYGTLRFYMSSETQEMSNLISVAEDLSAVTCETCGKPGKERGRGWYYTACDEHTRKEDLDEWDE